MKYPSKLIEEAVTEIAKLPGIGRKSALRLALHLLKADGSQTQRLTNALNRLKKETQFCQECHNLSDQTFCQICLSPKRDRHILCVVQDIRDVMAIENTGQFQGLYHVLGGIISPLSGIGPDDLFIDSLIERIHKRSSDEPIQEIILALSPTMEGDTTAYYLRKKLEPLAVRLTTIARGIPIGGDLEYTDEITLGRSIATRILF